MSQTEKGERFRELHAGPAIFVMPNAWNAGSACLMVEAGVPAIATTSAGIAYSMGRPDWAAAVSRDEMLAEVARIAAAVDVPVSVDLEDGYGATPDAVGETIRAAVEAGVVGGNVEDHRPGDAAELFPLAEAATRIGADCVFVPGMSERRDIEHLVEAVTVPVTQVMGLSGLRMTMAELEAVGVRRVSIGGSLARATFALVRDAIAEIVAHGTFSYADRQIPDRELGALFASIASPRS